MEREDIRDRTYELNLKFGMGTSFDIKICSVIQRTIYDSLWTEYTVYADNTVGIRGFTSLNRRENLLNDMEPITIKITDEETEMLKNCIITEMRDELVDNPWQNTNFYDDYNGDISDYYTVVQYYKKSGAKSYYCADDMRVHPLEKVFCFDVLGFDNYLRYTSQVCEVYFEKLGRNISFDDVLCYYTQQPYTTDKNGEKIAVKFTMLNETGTLKVAIGPLSDVKGEHNIVSREYKWEEYLHWGVWETYLWAANIGELTESQPDYKNIGAHISFLGEDGNVISYISDGSEINDFLIEGIESCLINDNITEDIETMKLEAKKLMQ